ncbi:unnamed protein product, partial [Didymodactylos carnosus]
KYLESGGTKKQKLDEIDDATYEFFKNARESLSFVHDIDLKRQALKKARELDDQTFCVSDNWLNLFKHRHGICSRHVTKLVTKRETENADNINKSADDFVVKVQKIIPKYKPELVLNTDQSGLQLEMHSNHTLSFEAEKITVAKVRSVHNTTHSYTVQPLISMEGNCVGPIFLCLKEPTGHLSDPVRKSLFQADNVVVTCSKSGKLITSLVECWVDKVLQPTVKDKKCLLLSDYWGGERDVNHYEKVKNLERLEIPKKTTSMIQPLDVCYLLEKVDFHFENFKVCT